MSAYKDFDAALDEHLARIADDPEAPPPITFHLGAQPAARRLAKLLEEEPDTEQAIAAHAIQVADAEREMEEHLFSVPLPLPAGPVFEWATFGGASRGSLAYIAACQDFICAVVDKEQKPMMRRTLKTCGGDLDFLDELVKWIVQESTAAPLPQSESSPSEPSTTGEASRPDSPSEASGSTTSLEVVPDAQ